MFQKGNKICRPGFDRDHKIRIIVGGLKGEQRTERILELVTYTPQELNKRLTLRLKIMRMREKIRRQLPPNMR